MFTKLIHSFIFSKRCDKDPGLYYFSYKDFPLLKHELTYFKDRNNIDIASHLYYYDSKENKDIIIFAHGFGGGHDCYIKEIEYFAKNGYIIYAFDALATFASKGKRQNGLLEMSLTLDYFINYVNKNNFNNKKINIIGHSLGGYSVALNLIRHKFNKVVLLSPLRNVYYSLSNFTKNKKIMNSSVKIESKKFNIPVSELDTSFYLNKYDGETMIVFSSDDKILNYEDNFVSLKEKLNGKNNIIFYTVEGKSHYPTYALSSVKKLEEYFALKNKTKGKKKLIALKEKQDWNELYKLDYDFMNIINDFLKS